MTCWVVYCNGVHNCECAFGVCLNNKFSNNIKGNSSKAKLNLVLKIIFAKLLFSYFFHFGRSCEKAIIRCFKFVCGRTTTTTTKMTTTMTTTATTTINITTATARTFVLPLKVCLTFEYNNCFFLSFLCFNEIASWQQFIIACKLVKTINKE